MNKKIMQFQSNIDKTSIEKVNPEFAKVKVYVMYHGKNRNYTVMEKEVVEKALYSLKGVPVVGHYKEDTDSFGGHDSKIEIENDIKIIDLTKPYGFVPFEAEMKWEEVLEKDGLTKNEYLVTEAYLWVGRYPEVEKVLDNIQNQSMEIMVNDSDYQEDGYLNIKDFTFSALCVLGRDEVNEENNVEPCFESSRIGRYEETKEIFNQEFSEMIQKYKSFSVEEVKEENIDNEEVTEIEEVVVDESKVDNSIDKEQSDEVEELDKETETVEETVEIEEEVEENESKEDEFDYKEEYKNLIDKFNSLEETNKNLSEKVSELESLNKELNEFKVNAEKEQRIKDIEVITSKFELSEDEIKDIRLKVENNEVSLEAYEEKLYALTGKKLKEKYALTLNDNKEQVLETKMFSKDKEDKCPYGSLASYFK